ncbi:MAG: 2-C-methyl-D-erythritol 2,4-cyclodiphosphate synthase [Solirubrobacteraceae bacterium]
MTAPALRSGIGYDCHRLAEGRPLVLGGVELPAERGLDGHSDADVLTHAIIDALLGAAALDDIGAHFPDTDPAHAGASSLGLLRDTVKLLAGRGMTPGNVDATVVMERPRLAPHRGAIRSALAGALGVEEDRVGVKATRGEGMGFVGREEGVAALAVATVVDSAGGGQAG